MLKITYRKQIIMKIQLRLTLIAFIILLPITARSQGLTAETYKIGRVLSLLDARYVDSVNISKMAEEMIVNTLKKLDPHSVYVPQKDVAEENESMQGNFEGIGVQFNLLNDTVIIISPTPGGPSEKAGIISGDRIIEIAGEKVTGIGITTEGVRNRLMGPKGTVVYLKIFRKGLSKILEKSITRDKIPVNSLDAAYMVSGNIGYIKLNRFSETTSSEFNDAVAKLRNEKMENLIIDLRSNTGGIMNSAVAIADQMLDPGKLIVYIQGLHTPRQDFVSTSLETLGNARIAILTDEESASASEILTGAIQDWDRGIVIGRRTFGKGLVQNRFLLPDGSMIRLTVARYYTPSGRSIQTPYSDGVDKYYQKYYNRYLNGELLHADSINLPDSLKTYTLLNKRAVYSGGGITPDIFIPIDTSNYSEYYRDLIRTSTITSFTLSYVDKHRKELQSRYKTFEKFDKNFIFDDKAIKDLIAAGEKNGVHYSEEGYKNSSGSMLQIMKALVARDLWGMNEYFRVANKTDNAIKKASDIIANVELYNEMLGFGKGKK
jgi:carboxyl-terminal processing protease